MLLFLVMFLLPGIHDAPASASQVLGLQVCTTMLSLGFQIFFLFWTLLLEFTKRVMCPFILETNTVPTVSKYTNAV